MNSSTESTLPELLLNTAKRFPSKIALRIGDFSLTYAQTAEYCRQTTAHLQKIGIKKGDRIVIVSENRPEWVIAFFGATGAGCTVVCLDTLLTDTEIKQIIENSEPRLVFSTSNLIKKFQNFAQETSNRFDVLDIHDVLALGNGTPEPVALSSTDTAILIYTSGTTGSQKGVMLSHGNLTFNVKAAFERVSYKPGTSYLSLLPLSHMLGITIGMLGPLYNGASLSSVSSLRSTEILATMQQARTEVVVVVPLMLKLFRNSIKEKIDNSPALTRALFSACYSASRFFNKLRIGIGRLLFNKIHRSFGGHIRYFICGGAPLEPEIQEFFETIGMPVLQGYGLTETSPVVSVNALRERRPRSVGKPLNGVEVTITGTGEILIKGPSVMQGYYKDEAATRKVMPDGWFHTGDLGTMDRDGFLYISGRDKNVIVTSGGLKIFPEELESVLSRSPRIREVCVFGRGGAKGEYPYAAIYPDPAWSCHTTAGEITRAIRDELEALQNEIATQKRVALFQIFTTELPKTTTRKIKRAEVKRLVEESVNQKQDTSDEIAMSGISATVRTIVAKTVNAVENSIRWDSNLTTDLGIDSLMKIDLLCLIEKQTGISIPEEHSYEAETFKDLVDLVERYAESPAGARECAVLADVDTSAAESLQAGSFFRFTRSIVSIACRIFCRIYFRLKVQHPERVPVDGPCILASNHASLLDFPIINAAIPRSMMRRTAAPAAKDFFFENPISAALVTAGFNAFPLARHGNFIEGLKVCAGILKNGMSIVLFPEGTRSPDDSLQPFKPGIGMLSCELDIPVVPIYIEGAGAAMPKGSILLHPAQVRVTFGHPIYPKKLAGNNGTEPRHLKYKRLVGKLREQILALKEDACRT